MAQDNMSQMPMSPTDKQQNMEDFMRTSFFWGKDVLLLFAGWPGAGHLGLYILALVVVFMLAAGAEILSVAPKWPSRSLKPAVGALVHALVLATRMTLAYLVMLSVMSFNLGVFLVAVAGHAVGSYIVRYRALAMDARALDSPPK